MGISTLLTMTMAKGKAKGKN